MAIYGDTHTDEDAHFCEFILVANVKIFKNLDFQIDVSSDDIETGRNKVFMN